MSSLVTLRFLEDDAEIRKINELNNAQIKKDIVGEWKPAFSHNTAAYLNLKNRDKRFESNFLTANQTFLVDEREVTQFKVIGGKVISQFHSRIGFKTTKKQYRCKTTVEQRGTVLKTEQVRFLSNGMGKTYDIEERFVRDGHLHIVNQLNKLDVDRWDVVRCTRVYKKVQSQEVISETIKEELNGEWTPVTVTGRISEYCQELGVERQQLLIDNNISFSVLKYFNEVHETNGCNKTVITLDEERTGMMSFFKDISLITVGNRIEITRFVLNGQLLITHSKDRHSFTVVYDKV